MKITWKNSVKNLTTDEAIHITQKVFEFLEKYKPHYVLQDNSMTKFAYTSEYIHWILKELTPRLSEIGVKKIVYVAPSEMITKIGLEIFFHEASHLNSDVKRNLVDNVAQGELWLFEDEPLDYKPFSEDGEPYE